MSGPCSWPVSYAACTGGVRPEPLASMPASGIEIFEGMAAEYLWDWTGQVFGVCSVAVRPCRQDCADDVSTFWGSGPMVDGFGAWRPVIIDGLWYNLGCGRCRDSCACHRVASLKLPGPIASVTSVTIDGEVLDPSAYYVDNGDTLIRVDGGEWPRCNDYSRPTTEPGTWEVVYDRGTSVPVGGQVAAGVLAVQLAKASCGDKTCDLPQRVQTITRQGVTVAMLDAFDDIDSGHTGIWIIDSWIASVTKSPRRSAVLSPDKPVATH